MLRRRILRALATLGEATSLLASSREALHRAAFHHSAADPVDAWIFTNRLELRINHNHFKVLERRILWKGIQKCIA